MERMREEGRKSMQRMGQWAAQSSLQAVTLYEATKHSLASIAACNGAPLMAIKDVLGHTDIRTTMKYAHTDIESQKVVFQKKTEVITLSQ